MDRTCRGERIKTKDSPINDAISSARSSILVCAVLIILSSGFKGVYAETLTDIATAPATTESATESGRNPPDEIRKPENAAQPRPEAGATSPEPERKVNPCAFAESEGETWLDQTHSFVEAHLCQPAVWFDSFFGQERVVEDLHPGSFVKLRNTVRLSEGGAVDYIPDFTVRWRLPQLENFLNKAKIFIVSASDSDKFTTQPGQALSPGVDPATGARKSIAGLQFDHFTWLYSLISMDAGIKLAIHPDPFFRTRYQYARPFGDMYLVRFIQTALTSYTRHFTETSEFDLERKITTFTLLRWSNYATYLKGTPGVSWNSGISLIAELTPKSAVSFDTSIWGVNHPEWTVDNYRVGSRYRRNVYRPWLFIEVAPEVTWPKDVTGHRNSLFALMGTLEIQFGK